MKVKIGVVGSRRRNSEQDYLIVLNAVKFLLDKYKEHDIEFVSGGCKLGADNFISIICKELQLSLVEYLPQIKDDMNYHDRVKAYYARNELIANHCDFLVALPHKDRKGGTESTLKFCEKLKKDIVLL